MHMLCTPESSVQSTPKTWTTPHAPHGEFLKLCALVHARARVVEAPATFQDLFVDDDFHLVKTEDKGFYFLDICFYFLDIDRLIFWK